MAEQEGGKPTLDVHDEEAKKARQAAREERARARALKKQQEEAEAVEHAGEAAPETPRSPQQLLLDQVVSLIKREVAEEAVVESYINALDRNLPCMVIAPEHWLRTAKLLKEHEQLNLHYLRNVAGVDQTTHMEVVYDLVSLSVGQDYFIKVKTDRDQPSVPSVAGIWRTADWNEREIYDLLGVDFPGHPNLKRIMMPDDWVGHPLRKDYEAYDPEV